MKRLSLAFTLLLLGSLSLAAVDAPAVAPQPIFQAPGGNCPLGKNAPMEKPMFKSYLPPTCIAYTTCSDGSSVSCPPSYSSGCLWKDGCYVICDDNSVIYCPGARQDPACIPE
jgi:hypothetical protein